MYKKLMYVFSVAVLLVAAGGLQAAMLQITPDAPVPGMKDIANLVGSASDVDNIGGVEGAVYDNDVVTYIAHDRGSQGQTFVTGAEDVVMTGVWVRHVLYTTEVDTTWYRMQPGGQLLIRVTDPAASGTDAFVLASETYDVTGEEENALPADTTNDATGTGMWFHLTLDEPVALAANTEYGFDITSVSGLEGVMFFETMGIKDDAEGGNPYADGTAFVTGAAGVADNNMVPAAGDRVFVVEFAGPSPTHLYTFEDGTANDSVGEAHGVLIGGAVVEGGALVTAAQDQWMEMPGDVIAINTYDAVTVEAFYTPTAGANTSWTMLAYFGDSTDPDPTAGVGNDGFFITSARGDDVSRAAISVGNPEAPYSVESGANGPEYDDGLPHHIASTIDDTEITLYLDGELIAATELSETNKLSGLSTNYALLAKGGYGSDPEWIGEIEEFRIFDVALTEDELAASYAAGPTKVGPQPVDPGDEGLVAYYPLDSAGRGVTPDASGNGLDGTVVGDPEFVEGVVGQALDLNGDDLVECGNNPLFAMQDTNQMTVSAWVTVRSVAAAWQAAVAKGENAWRLGNVNLDPRFHFGITIWNAPDTASIDGVTAVGFDEWHHIAGTFDGANISVWLDGVVDATVTTTEPIGTNDFGVIVGNNPESMERYWDGLIDEVYIYNRALSDLEIMYLSGQ